MDAEDNSHKFQFAVDRKASPDDALTIADVKELIERARLFEKLYNENARTLDSAFGQLVEALYGAGMIMRDFNGPLFDQGPFWFIRDQGFARILRNHSSLLTIRMYLHTMQRGHYFTSGMGGFPYFQEAIETGCFVAMIDRLEVLNNEAIREGRATVENVHP